MGKGLLERILQSHINEIDLHCPKVVDYTQLYANVPDFQYSRPTSELAKCAHACCFRSNIKFLLLTSI